MTKTKTATDKKQPIVFPIKIPEGITVEVKDRYNIVVKKADKMLSRKMANKLVSFAIENHEVIFKAVGATRTEFKVIRTFEAHLRNMFRGVSEGHTYKLKICNSHFPINAAVNNGVFEVKNFLGEKFARLYKLKPGVSVKIQGSEITVHSNDKELAGLTAGALEQLTKVRNKDRRVFQDGIYITIKDNKAI